MTTVTDVRNHDAGVVRFHRAPLAVRVAFRFLEHTAPGLGARWAERIWFRLPARRAGPARPAAAGPARPASAGTPGPAGPATAGTTVRIDVDGRAVMTESWGDGPVVYLVHGWAGTRHDLAAFAAPLVARGHRVVAFDAPSHGESAPGAFGPHASSLPEFIRALHAVVGVHGPAHAVVAHSMGAAAAAVALSDGMRTGRLAMLAPIASMTSYARRFAAMLGCGPRIRRRLVRRIERRIVMPLVCFEVPALGRAVTMPPTLIVHDTDDRSIPVADGSAIATAWTSARMHTTSGLGHRRLLRDPDVVAAVVDFVVYLDAHGGTGADA
jgi:pimeloyl-ACP methyl ester carboxylesterase